MRYFYYIVAGLIIGLVVNLFDHSSCFNDASKLSLSTSVVFTVVLLSTYIKDYCVFKVINECMGFAIAFFMSGLYGGLIAVYLTTNIIVLNQPVLLN